MTEFKRIEGDGNEGGSESFARNALLTRIHGAMAEMMSTGGVDSELPQLQRLADEVMAGTKTVKDAERELNGVVGGRQDYR